MEDAAWIWVELDAVSKDFFALIDDDVQKLHSLPAR